MFWLIFALFSSCALHSNIGVFESNQPTVQIGMDILPETIYDAIENMDDDTTKEDQIQSVSYSNFKMTPHTTKFTLQKYKGWGSQTMMVFETDHMLLGFGSHRSYWFPLSKKLWLTSRIGVQLAQLKLESDQMSINFISPYSDLGITYLLSNTTALSLRGIAQSNLFLLAQDNSLNYGFILGISKGIHPASKY